MNDFKMREYSLRKKEADAVLKKYPKSIPIIIFPKYENAPKLKKHKYIVPNSLKCAHLFNIIRTQLDIQKETALFFFLDEKILLSAATPLIDIYKYKNDDGFLYIHYSLENVFG